MFGTIVAYRMVQTKTHKDMYKAIEIQNEAVKRLETLARGFIMDIVSHRIKEGIYDEDPDGQYSIDTIGKGIYTDVWVYDTYESDTYLENMEVKEICLGEKNYGPYIVVGENNEEIYFHSLPFNSISGICCVLEDLYDEEVGE